MRMLVTLCAVVVAACGGSATPAPSTPAVVAKPAPAKHLPDRIQMLAAFPADTNIILATDIKKLRASPIASRIWDAIDAGSSKVNDSLGPLCGAWQTASYALLAIQMKPDGEPADGWVWIMGIPRNAKLDCQQAKEHDAKHPSKTERHGDYEIETTDDSVMEGIWLDGTTAFFHYHEKDKPQIGEARLREMIDKGGGFGGADAPAGALLDHVDFESGLAVAVTGEAVKRGGLTGVAISVEAHDDLRAQLYAVLDDEDRASSMRDQYRSLFDKLTAAHLIDASDITLNATAMSASVTITRDQLERWITVISSKLKTP